MHDQRGDHGRSIWRGAVAGLAAGAAASWAMSRFQAALTEASDAARHQRGPAGRENSSRQHDDEDATARAAEAVAGTVGHRN